MLDVRTITDDISIHKALAGLDLNQCVKHIFRVISIHKALAGLDQSRPEDGTI